MAAQGEAIPVLAYGMSLTGFISPQVATCSRGGVLMSFVFTPRAALQESASQCL